MKTFILFDTNIWLSELGLQSGSASAVRYFAKRQSAVIAVPEVVQKEVEFKLIQQFVKLKKSIEDAKYQLSPFFKNLVVFNVPSKEDIQDIVAKIIPDLDVSVHSIPVSSQSVVDALDRTVRKLPPSSENRENFRDCLIWHICLELIDEGDVYFVSNDRDFYENRDFSKGLSHSLVKEMENRSNEHRVILKKTVGDLLEDIKTERVLDIYKIFDIVTQHQMDRIDSLLSAHKFELCGKMEGSAKLFATEEADRLYFTFDLKHPCVRQDVLNREQGELKLKGDGFYYPEEGKTSNVGLFNILLDYPSWVPDPDLARGTTFLRTKGSSIHRLQFEIETV